VWNAGVILWLAGAAKDLAEGRKKADETLTQGAARTAGEVEDVESGEVSLRLR